MAERGAAGTPARRGETAFSVLSTIGDVLLLQVLFLLTCVGVVTIIPGAIAVQRALPEALAQEHPAIARLYWRNLRWAVRNFWHFGLGVCVVTVVLVFSLLFWASAGDPIRLIGLGVLVPVAGLLVALYLAFLAVVMTSAWETGPRQIGREAWLLVQRKPLHAAGSILLLSTWLLLLARLPTLVLVGTALVPAFLAWWLARDSR
ncbi:hypothetical protein [Kribbella deserti]|uniref:DUF624 domain-containing protein n=1 Tax=Kribbella deserti TaxID=1926257 RepID=A0ABV6QJZ1_9ACTN